jgi:DNA-binding CsgD family transcriptional regulator
MKTFEVQSFEPILKNRTFSGKYSAAFIRQIAMTSSMPTESVYAVDMRQRQFCYIKPHDLFLCGHSVEEAAVQGFNFFLKTVYPDDLPLLEKKQKAIFRYLNGCVQKGNDIGHFFCTFRLQRKYSTDSKPVPQMVYHRIEHYWEGDELRWLVCHAGISTARESGNLRIYHKDGLTYREYSFKTGRWNLKTVKSLTEGEKAILMLAGQAKSTKETADCLHRSYHTIRNQMKALFEKLEVNSVRAAIDFAINHRMLYTLKQAVSESGQPPVEMSGQKPGLRGCLDFII